MQCAGRSRDERRTVGAVTAVALASRFWGLGCPKIFHEVATLLPNGMARFEEFNAFMTLADQAVVNAGLAGVIQMVAFHPGILFAETDEEDPANYTNRSPYPMLHLIREDDLEAAVAGYPDPDAIPERNIRLLRRMGLTRVRELLARCYTASAT
ncbi:MAG: hypothetical protein C3L24_04280 [Candidatus Sedimenticola endophacoides]|uniref:DUF1415 domain-containing protein n=1 Tax=Candidatus Sedimenticola endophacoides TaxID=2548426 RepID=A0A6N4E1V4_9GAMM|nr:MAG: hypothetical protein C3L24_04280 [Candidatus Sedimenticola endophacoides]